jgi:hypothetical protein
VVTNCESLWSFYKKVILITKGMFDSDTNVRVGLNVLRVKKPANLLNTSIQLVLSWNSSHSQNTIPNILMRISLVAQARLDDLHLTT